MAEPTSVLLFSDLITEVAYFLSISDYLGDGTPTVPTDLHDLVLCKRIVNKAIRMFIHDAPKQGWRWTSPTASLILWPDVAVSAATVSGGAFASGVTTLTASTASFYPSMEYKTITVTGSGTFTIQSYTDSTHVVVSGNASAVVAKTFSIANNGAFTMPATFGGQYNGQITYAAGTNKGVRPVWTDESVIRNHYSNTVSTGTPYKFAVRPMDVGSPRRRWETLTWFAPSEVLTVQFPYTLHFDNLVNLTDSSPAPFSHDETLKAACLAQAEMDVRELVDGPKMKYYKESALVQSYGVDARSAPQALGYFGNPSIRKGANRDWRDDYPRPTVEV